MVEQEDSLFELNRILKLGGIAMFTGKNIDYFDDDSATFIAERNAKIKDFPNHFTDLHKMIANLKEYGFLFEKLFIFFRRGDMGLNMKFVSGPEISSRFYEYCFF